jgi:Asp-tRNA(Asn)/Glu-tRNA(Gln) amidotransferase A subunit family amidase
MTTDITHENVARMLECVTPGPWVLDVLQGYDSFDDPMDSDVEITTANGKYIHGHDLGYRDDTDEEIKANARFIAYAREAVPALSARVAELEALLVEARDDLAAYVENDWPADLRATFPSLQDKWRRDMELHHRIDAALQENKP